MAITIIINPISGGASIERARERAELAATIADARGNAAEVFVTERRGHAREIAKRAVERGSRLVVAWGGDGTMNEVASALAFQDRTALALVPAGSGNGLARELGISRRPIEAISDALTARPRAMDLGEIEGRLFVNIAGVGFDAYVAAQFDQPGNRRRGLVKYASISVGAIRTYVSRQYVVTTPDRRLHPRAILISIANSPQFGNGARIAPGARVDDGLLDLVVVEERTRWRTLWQLPRLFNSTVDRIPGCSIQRIERATIESAEPMMFHVDGEPVPGGTRLAVSVHPGALRIAVK